LLYTRVLGRGGMAVRSPLGDVVRCQRWAHGSRTAPWSPLATVGALPLDSSRHDQDPPPCHEQGSGGL